MGEVSEAPKRGSGSCIIRAPSVKRMDAAPVVMIGQVRAKSLCNRQPKWFQSVRWVTPGALICFVAILGGTVVLDGYVTKKTGT